MWATLLHLTPNQSRAGQTKTKCQKHHSPIQNSWCDFTKQKMFRYLQLQTHSPGKRLIGFSTIFTIFSLLAATGCQSVSHPFTAVPYSCRNCFFCISLSIFFNFPNIFAFEGLEKCQHTPFFCVYSRLFAC